MRKFTITIGLTSALIAMLTVGPAAAEKRAKVHPDQPTVQDRIKDKSPSEALDRLFGLLHVEKSPRQANALAAIIWRIWSRSESPTATVLLRQGQRAMKAGQTRRALRIFTVLVRQHPNFAEGWNKRATAFFLANDLERSKADIAEVLAREPRHFGALSGLGLIYQRQGKHRKALAAYRRALSIHPHLPVAKRAVRILSKKLEQDI